MVAERAPSLSVDAMLVVADDKDDQKVVLLLPSIPLEMRISKADAMKLAEQIIEIAAKLD